MAGVMDSVNQRTQLVGQNRLELLLFRLDGKQLYGINVFKVREVLQCPKLTIMPKSNPVVCGVANIRGSTIPILDLAMATGSAGLQDRESPFVIITEYNTKTQGFLVRSVERIVNMNWEEIHPPPKGTGRDHYLTAVTRVDNQLWKSSTWRRSSQRWRPLRSIFRWVWWMSRPSRRPCPCGC